MTRAFRRVVTGHDENGKSVVLSDAAAATFGRFYEMWATDEAPATYPEDPVEGRRVKLEPTPNGNAFRFFRVEPRDPSISSEDLEIQVARGFEAIGAAHCRPDTSRSPHMHETKTVDYIILLQGQVTLLLDEEEVDLTPFDVVIQRGTNHAWINKGTETAYLAAILIDAEPRR